MRWMGGLLFSLILLSCAAPQVLWVVDSLQAPVLGEEFSQQLSYVERESGYRIKTTAYSFRENDRFVLEKELSEGTYPYVVVSPYVALELEALEVRFPGVTFLCMDAPRTLFSSSKCVGDLFRSGSSPEGGFPSMGTVPPLQNPKR